MLYWILNILSNDSIKQLIINALEILVKRTDAGIDYNLLALMLDKSVKSKRNKLTNDIKNEILKRIK